ncbi:hypothetical protein [Enterococcus faecalis]|nr:hypothetical protein [Enterococcus faecalis]MCO8259119.1 hypothetical protein [Enterococcus faecalis]MCP8907195.1 hypothetical protein [Enterococcus faecalis]MCP8910227.1 hypothetical protein [Enterococcus faecalis]MCP8913298.1 hypothetical protein [Enterococcus faecalis]MCP8936093.1 hypothetical protein [Enterococcus faecalis]
MMKLILKENGVNVGHVCNPLMNVPEDEMAGVFKLKDKIDEAIKMFCE